MSKLVGNKLPLPSIWNQDNSTALPIPKIQFTNRNKNISSDLSYVSNIENATQKSQKKNSIKFQYKDFNLKNEKIQLKNNIIDQNSFIKDIH